MLPRNIASKYYFYVNSYLSVVLQLSRRKNLYAKTVFLHFLKLCKYGLFSYQKPSSVFLNVTLRRTVCCFFEINRKRIHNTNHLSPEVCFIFGAHTHNFSTSAESLKNRWALFSCKAPFYDKQNTINIFIYETNVNSTAQTWLRDLASVLCLNKLDLSLTPLFNGLSLPRCIWLNVFKNSITVCEIMVKGVIGSHYHNKDIGDGEK